MGARKLDPSPTCLGVPTCVGVPTIHNKEIACFLVSSLVSFLVSSLVSFLVSFALLALLALVTLLCFPLVSFGLPSLGSTHFDWRKLDPSPTCLGVATCLGVPTIHNKEIAPQLSYSPIKLA